MKRFLTFFVLSGAIFLLGCGSSTSPQVTTTDSSRENTDFGPYTGQEFAINQTKDMSDFQVTLNKIIVGNTNFGKYADGYAGLIVTGYASQWIIGDFTITSRIAMANIESLQFGIGWKTNGGGEIFNSAVFSGQLTTGAQKFGFYQDGYSLPLSGGESKNIKVIISMLTNFSGNGPYTFNIGDENHLMDDNRILLEFPLGQYLVH